MHYTLGVIGVGNMGAALVRSIVRAGALPPHQIAIFDVATEKAQALANELGVARIDSASALAMQSEYVLLAVKPGILGHQNGIYYITGKEPGHRLQVTANE